MLAKAGCSSGACHGAAAGQNGFKLSLRGYDYDGDFLALTRQSFGRRINPVDPAQSLVLLKPTAAVPHKGGNESVQGVLGRQVDFALESPVILLSLIKEGKVRALAVTSAKRQAEIPDVPTMMESGVTGFVATLLTGIVAPAGTPSAIVGKLNGVINETLMAADMKDLVVKFGSEVRTGSPQEFATFLAGETRKWAKIAREAGVSLD